MSTGIPHPHTTQNPPPTTTTTAAPATAGELAEGTAQTGGPRTSTMGEKIKAPFTIVHGTGEAIRGTILTPFNKSEGEELVKKGREEFKQGMGVLRPHKTAAQSAGQVPQPPSAPTGPGSAPQTGAPATSAQGIPPQQQVNPTPPGKYTEYAPSQAAPPGAQGDRYQQQVNPTLPGEHPESAPSQAAAHGAQGGGYQQQVKSTPLDGYPESARSQAAAPGPQGGEYDLPEKGPAAPGGSATQEGVSTESERLQVASPNATTGENRAVPSSTPRTSGSAT